MSKELDEIKGDLREIKTHLDWYWKTTALIGTGILFLFYWTFIGAKPSDQKVAMKIESLTNQVATLNATIQLSQPDAGKELPKMMVSALDDPDKQVGAARLGALAEVAKEKKITTDEAAVRQIGREAKNVLARNAPTWQALLSLAAYTSTLTKNPVILKGLAEVPIDTFPGPPRFGPGFYIPKGILFTVFGEASLDEGSLFCRIPECDAEIKRGKASGNISAAWTVLDFQGGAFEIDGSLFRRVVFKNAKITYRGGEYVLTNVYFLDCIFDFHQSDKSDRLLEALFATADGNVIQSAKSFANVHTPSVIPTSIASVTRNLP
jgi:hypothetical protein